MSVGFLRSMTIFQIKSGVEEENLSVTVGCEFDGFMELVQAAQK